MFNRHFLNVCHLKNGTFFSSFQQLLGIVSNLEINDPAEHYVKFGRGFADVYCISCIFFLLSRESNHNAITSSLRSCLPSVYPNRMGESRQVPFPTAPQVNLLACSPHCPFNAELQTGEAVNTNFIVIGWPNSK